MKQEFIKYNEIDAYLEDLLDRIVTAIGMTKEEIRLKNRRTELVNARCLYCYLAYTQGISPINIGKYINRTHANVIHLVNRTVIALKKHDDKMMDLIRLLLENAQLVTEHVNKFKIE